jgi:hypothetical protein
LNQGYVGCFTFILCSFEESRLLISWCAGATWHASTMIIAGVGDIVQRIGDGPTYRIHDDRTIGRSGDTVCGLHHTRRDEECGFLG